MPLVRTRGISLPNGMEESLSKNNSYLLRQFNIKVFYCAYFYKFTILKLKIIAEKPLTSIFVIIFPVLFPNRPNLSNLFSSTSNSNPKRQLNPVLTGGKTEVFNKYFHSSLKFLELISNHG